MPTRKAVKKLMKKRLGSHHKVSTNVTPERTSSNRARLTEKSLNEFVQNRSVFLAKWEDWAEIEAVKAETRARREGGKSHAV